MNRRNTQTQVIKFLYPAPAVTSVTLQSSRSDRLIRVLWPEAAEGPELSPYEQGKNMGFGLSPAFISSIPFAS